MSKPNVSSYRRNIGNNNRPDNSNRSPYRQQPCKLSQRSKLNHNGIIGDQNSYQRNNGIKNTDELIKTMEKKKSFQPVGFTRLETLVQQNKLLLVENNQLTNLLSDRNRVIVSLEHKLQQQIMQQVQTLEEIEFQKNKFLEEYANKMKQQSAKNDRLMNQIKQLNEDIYQLQIKKKRQIQNIKESYSRDHKSQLDNVINNHTQTLQILQIQNNKLKQTISNKENQIQCLTYQLKSSNQKLKNKNQQLQKTLNHVTHMKKLQLSEQKIYYQKIVQDIKRESQKTKQISSMQYENELKRVKKQLLLKNIQTQKLDNNISSTTIETQLRINQLEQQKTDLQNQLQQMTKSQKQLFFDQMQRIKHLTKLQIQSCQNFNKQIIQNLKNDIFKLQSINQTRIKQIQKLNSLLFQFRSIKDQENYDLHLQIENMKQFIHQEKQSFIQSNQTMKIKLAKLRYNDINSLQQYYQNQLSKITEQLQLKQTIIQQNRDKIHSQIQQKTQMRKSYEIRINELMIKIGHLQNKIAITIAQKKEQLSKAEQKLKITQISLLKASQQKQKYSKSLQEQKQRLQKIIQSKDKQIDELNEQIKLLQNNYTNETKNKQQQIQILKKTIDDLELNLKKQKYFLQNQIKKKDNIYKNNKQFYQFEIARVKKQTMEEFNRIITEVNNQKNVIDDDRKRLKKIQKQLNDQLKQEQQFREQENIDKQLALNESMSRINSEKQLQEKNLKQYFQKQADEKNNQIRDLKQQISELNDDIRSHIQKQQKLEQKIKNLLQSQQKLRDMQQRVIVLGQDNNLIKNLSQIVKNKKK